MEICQKIITINAQVIEPYEILADIYEKMGDVRRHYIIKHISAEIKKTDTDCWLECARLAVELQKWVDAKKCYNRALK